jgi:hypothetical protein
MGDIAALAVSIASLSVMFISVLMWGLKLEARLEVANRDIYSLNTSIAAFRAQIASGILPRAEERINRLQDRVKELGDDFDDHDNMHQN